MANYILPGKLSYEPYALEKIIGFTARQVPGILALRGSLIQDLTHSFESEDVDPSLGVLTQAQKEGIEVFIRLALAYDRPGPETLEELKIELSHSLKAQTGLSLLALHVEVVDMLSEDEIERQKRSRFLSYG